MSQGTMEVRLQDEGEDEKRNKTQNSLMRSMNLVWSMVVRIRRGSLVAEAGWVSGNLPEGQLKAKSISNHILTSQEWPECFNLQILVNFEYRSLGFQLIWFIFFLLYCTAVIHHL